MTLTEEVAVFSLSLTQGEIPSHTPPNAEPVNSSAAIACEHAALVGAVLVQHDWLPPTCTRMDGEIEKMDASRRTPSCLQALASAGFLAGTVFFAASSCQILGLPLPHLQRDRTYPCPTSIKRRIGKWQSTGLHLLRIAAAAIPVRAVRAERR